jgi:hypothetical protein
MDLVMMNGLMAVPSELMHYTPLLLAIPDHRNVLHIFCPLENGCGQSFYILIAGVSDTKPCLIKIIDLLLMDFV